MKWILFIFLSTSVKAANSPYYIRSVQSGQDLGGINQNFSDIASCFQNSLTTNLAPTFCPSGQALTGAYYNSCGTQFGGVCENVITSTSSSGLATLSGNNTFTGTNGFNNGIIIGDSSQVNPTPGIFMYARSIDGATQMGGCLGVLGMFGPQAGAVWTSTTTANTVGLLSVVVNNCSPGQICLFQIGGIAYIPQQSASTLGDCEATSTTRCDGSQTNNASITCHGMILQSAAGAQTLPVALMGS